ncbi:hypothetical protein BJX68DRAFT_270388 [Aspergillus pseudodeflectus]|uniref:Uncharacterized protein n=1 Tax=Aspergillus pseudodeflectus TaxID=176178 RepID=A0ABR4JSR1_9EURO
MASFAFANLNPTNYLGGVSFRPERDIPDLGGKVVLVTGGNAGLGKETIRQLLQHNPAHIILAARSERKAQAALDELKASVRKAKINRPSLCHDKPVWLRSRGGSASWVDHIHKP